MSFIKGQGFVHDSGGGGGDVTPASLVTAALAMTPTQESDFRGAIGVNEPLREAAGLGVSGTLNYVPGFLLMPGEGARFRIILTGYSDTLAQYLLAAMSPTGVLTFSNVTVINGISDFTVGQSLFLNSSSATPGESISLEVDISASGSACLINVSETNAYTDFIVSIVKIANLN